IVDVVVALRERLQRLPALIDPLHSCVGLRWLCQTGAEIIRAPAIVTQVKRGGAGLPPTQRPMDIMTEAEYPPRGGRCLCRMVEHGVDHCSAYLVYIAALPVVRRWRHLLLPRRGGEPRREWLDAVAHRLYERSEWLHHRLAPCDLPTI